MTVYLVGAGPGDPGLITVRGAELLRRADVVVFDRLSARELLDLVPADAERIDVGKSSTGPSVPQERINELLVDLGSRHDHVVRLKGGDPFVFARGAEEAASLAAGGVDYEVVPGITSAIAAPAYAGIPVTLRYSSTSVTIVTGHEDPAKGRTDVDWESIAKVGGTIVVLMGVANLADISRRLIDGGLDPQTPAAAVRWGTTAAQHSERATIATLHERPLHAPSTIVIGAVAAKDLHWFESRPLFGRTVAVTRAPHQAGALSGRLRELGAEVVEVPTITIAEPGDGGAALADAARRVSEFDWVALTSPNGARRFLSRLRDARALGGVSVAVVGPGTADAVQQFGVTADLVAPRAIGESLVEAFARLHDRDGSPRPLRVLLPRAAVARDVVERGLAAQGHEVQVVEAYRTVPTPLDAAAIESITGSDVVTFTSASTVENYIAAGAPTSLSARVVCIGPITSAAASRHGLAVADEADPHTLDGLVDAVLRTLGQPPQHRPRRP